MKKTLYILLAAVAVLVSGCNFLDRQEDEQMTFEKIWQQVSTTRQYFFNCMGYLPNDATNFYGGTVIHGASDESSMTWNYPYRYINFGSWNATVVPNDNFNYYYQGIHDCSLFLKYVYTCSDPAASKADLDRWYWAVRWTRAYIYFLLMRDYGSVFLMGDDIIDPTGDALALQYPRNPWDECVKYVCDEMTECAGHLDADYNATYKGLPTSGAALAVISRLKLYSARDLFNGNRLYRLLINPDGTNVFPQEYDANKWVEAAQAAYDVINLNRYELYYDKEHSTNGCLNYYGVFQETWNKELIYCGGGYTSRWAIGIHTAPSDIETGDAYCGWGPTQQQVDAYAMDNGIYPINGYNSDGSPIVNPDSKYSANDELNGLVSVVNPFLTAMGASSDDATSQSPAMFQNREPRFYVNVYWPGCSWKHGDAYGRATFATGGKGNSGSQNYPKSGYLVNKWYDHTLDTYSSGQWGNITFPTFRYAEIILNYVEAVIECRLNGVTGENVDYSYAMSLWDSLRARCGLKSILASYPGADDSTLLDLIRRERRVELAHEGHRYYDTRTWMIAMDTDGGPMYGLDITVKSNLNADTPPKGMWNRHVFEERVFKPQHYLYPFLQRELDRNKNLVQNYGW